MIGFTVRASGGSSRYTSSSDGPLIDIADVCDLNAVFKQSSSSLSPLNGFEVAS